MPTPSLLPGAFFLYAVLAWLGLFFMLGCLPETQGLQLEEIENLFTRPLCYCGGSCTDGDHHVQYTRVNGSNHQFSDNDSSDVD